MKITTIVMATALAISLGCAFAAARALLAPPQVGRLGRQAALLVRGPA